MLPLALLVCLLPACSDDSLEEPAIYTPVQIRRLLFGANTKLWQQQTEYYLEDSCRTGYLLRFSQNAEQSNTQPFSAFFYRDTLACEVGEEPFILQRVRTPRSPVFQTTDSLVFQRSESDSTIRLIRLLTSQRMELDVVEGNEVVRREVFRVVEE